MNDWRFYPKFQLERHFDIRLSCASLDLNTTEYLCQKLAHIEKNRLSRDKLGIFWCYKDRLFAVFTQRPQDANSTEISIDSTFSEKMKKQVIEAFHLSIQNVAIIYHL